MKMSIKCKGIQRVHLSPIYMKYMKFECERKLLRAANYLKAVRLLISPKSPFSLPMRW